MSIFTVTNIANFMRSSIYLVALFISMSGVAQNYLDFGGANSSLEPPRSKVISYASVEEASQAQGERTTYYFPIDSLSSSQSGEATIYEFDFTPPFTWLNRQAILCVDSSSTPYTIEINGEEVGQSLIGVLPREFNVTRALEKEHNTITIRVNPDPTISKLEGWSHIGSPATPKVYLHSQPTMAVRDVEVESTYSNGALNSEFCIAIKSYALNRRLSRIHYELRDPYGNLVTHGNRDMTLEMRGEDTLRFATRVVDSLAWSPEKPQLFTLVTKTQYQGRYGEYQSYKIGLRSISTSKDGDLKINDKPLELNIATKDSTLDYQGVKQLQSEGINAVRLSAGPHNPDIYTIADSVGMLLIPTAPLNTSTSGETINKGGNSSNDPQLLDLFFDRVESMYHLVKLHPSVIGFAYAESSLNGNNLYECYLRLKSFDDQRPMIYLDVDGEWNSDRLNMKK